MAELESKTGPAGQVKAVKQVRIPKSVKRSFDRSGNHFVVPRQAFMICHGNFLVLKHGLG